MDTNKENWYLILDLEFDPNPVEDPLLIEQAITQKGKFWASQFNDFNYGSLYRKYHQMIPLIKEEMSNEAKRKQLIHEACQITYAPIDKLLKIIGRKGEISLLEIEKIQEKTNISQESILKRVERLGLSVKKNITARSNHLYKNYFKLKPEKSAVYDSLTSMLGSFGVTTLYDFLYLDFENHNAANLPYQELLQRAQNLKQTKYYKNDNISGTGSKLCGQCQLTFQNQVEKNIYDHYLSFEKRQKIAKDIDAIGEITGDVNEDEFELFSQQLADLLHDPFLAQELLVAYCEVKKIPYAVPNQLQDKQKAIMICRCGTANPDFPKAQFCRNCAFPLEISCPQCNLVHPNTTKVCACGFHLDNLDKSLALCEQATHAIKQLEFKQAQNFLDRADHYWPRISYSQNHRSLLQKNLALFQKPLSLLQACLNQKNFYHAKKIYQDLESQAPLFVHDQWKAEIFQALEEASRYFLDAKNQTSEILKIKLASQAYQACQDFPGISTFLANHPPEPPQNLQILVDVQNAYNQLIWQNSSSEGNISYTILRYPKGVAVDFSPDKILGETTINTFTDKTILPGEGYYYSIWANRSGIRSQPLLTKSATTNWFEIQDLKIKTGDGWVQLHWDSIPLQASAQIFRLENKDQWHLIATTKQTSFLDNTVKNDIAITYKVNLIYHMPLSVYETPGIKAQAIPTTPPSPTQIFQISLIEKNFYLAQWHQDPVNTNGHAPAPTQVELFYSHTPLPYSTGEVADLMTLKEYLSPLPLIDDQNKLDFLLKNPSFQAKVQEFCQNHRYNRQKIFKFWGDQPLFIAPLTIKNQIGTVGLIQRINHNEVVQIKHLQFINNKIHMDILSPPEVHHYQILFRHDEFPHSPQDPMANQIVLTAEQYLHHGRLVFSGLADKEYFFSLAAFFKINGQTYSSPWVQGHLSPQTKKMITYTLHYKKSFLDKGTLELVFHLPHTNFDLPAIEIKSNYFTPPMYKDAARTIHFIEAQRIENTSFCLQVPIAEKESKNLYIKAFWQNDDFNQNYLLNLDLKSRYKINEGGFHL